MKAKSISGMLIMLWGLLLISGCDPDPQNEPMPEKQLRSCQLIKETNSRFPTDFFYNPAGQLYRTVKTVDNALIIQNDISYNPAGQIAEININQYGGLHRNVFSYNSRNLPDTITYRDQAPSSTIRYAFEYDLAGRITKYSLLRPQDTLSPYYTVVTYPAPFQTKEELFARNAQGNIVLSRTMIKQYDNMKNPFAELKLYPELQFILLNHNVTTQTVVNHIDNSTHSVSNSYVYNPDGYPTQRVSKVNQQAADTTKWTYNCQ